MAQKAKKKGAVEKALAAHEDEFAAKGRKVKLTRAQVTGQSRSHSHQTLKPVVDSDDEDEGPGFNTKSTSVFDVLADMDDGDVLPSDEEEESEEEKEKEKEEPKKKKKGNGNQQQQQQKKGGNGGGGGGGQKKTGGASGGGKKTGGGGGQKKGGKK